MAITITKILGTDAMNASRITINNNFDTVEKAINELQALVSSNQIGVSTKSIVCSGINAGQNGLVTSGTVTCNKLKIGNATLNETQLAALLANLPQQP